ncbi:MAG TPA: tetratricopeptide repeat protein [Methanotrichaceae archaeon]|nr:tetratricopeptide repeat protein [Methanotrichaceae archaeon]
MNSKEKVLIHRAMDAVKRGRNAEALEMLDRVIASNPGIADAWNDKGVALFNMDRADEALECYDKALEIEPENMEALRNKGFVLRAVGRFEDALETYEKVLSKGKDALDLESKATVLVGLGRLEEAAACLKEALGISRSDRMEEELGAIQGLIEVRSQQ